MTELEIPRFGVLLAPYLGQVPDAARPRFLALLERGAAERYRQWAATLPEHAEVLLECAGAEDAIADHIEAVYDAPEGALEALAGALDGARDTYYAVFDGVDVWDQLRIQADAELQGAQAWRTIAGRETRPEALAALSTCSALEEASSKRLSALIAAHAG